MNVNLSLYAPTIFLFITKPIIIKPGAQPFRYNAFREMSCVEDQSNNVGQKGGNNRSYKNIIISSY